MRRDDFGGGDGTAEAVREFRAVASSAAALALSVPAWEKLLPGRMADVVGRHSGLYLPDFWTYTLHHLVWTRRLPYAIEASWQEGTEVGDEPFYFVSELPVDLGQASYDALAVLSEWLANRRLVFDASDDGGGLAPSRGLRLPSQVAGRWVIEDEEGEHREREATPAGDADDHPRAATPAAPPGSATAIATTTTTLASAPRSPDGGELVCDLETFSARCGWVSVSFSGRKKQLLALLARINRRPGHRVRCDDLRAVGDVWDGSPVEDSTIRGAVTRLRRTLAAGGLGSVAGRIRTGTFQGDGYVILDPPRPTLANGQAH